MSEEQGIMVVRVGVLDDADSLNASKPAAEIYTCERAGWAGKVEGSQQIEKFF